MEFFLSMIPPTKTHQQKQVNFKAKRFYEPSELKAVRQKLSDHIGPHRPAKPFDVGLRLITKWCFPKGRHKDGEYRLTKPDTDNLQKMLKDVMTDNHFWKDDCLVASEITEKFWAERPGIYIRIEELP